MRTRLAHRDRWPPAAAVATVAALQLLLADPLVPGARLVLPSLELVLAVAVVVATDHRLDLEERTLRAASLGLLTVVALVNTVSLVALVQRLLVRGTTDGRALLAGAAAIWLTNVVVFGLAYWETDRGGPLARSRLGPTAPPRLPELQFPQDADPHLAPEGWRPFFVDYLFVSLTAATAFSPTDVMPLTHRMKLLVGLQSLVSLLTVGLVTARAVNILQ